MSERDGCGPTLLPALLAALLPAGTVLALLALGDLRLGVLPAAVRAGHRPDLQRLLGHLYLLMLGCDYSEKLCRQLSFARRRLYLLSSRMRPPRGMPLNSSRFLALRSRLALSRASSEVSPRMPRRNSFLALRVRRRREAIFPLAMVLLLILIS